MGLVDTRKEVLRLYRVILRTSRGFQWKNENGEPWGKVLQQNARQEIDGARHITDTEEISKRLILAWDCVKQIQDKLIEKHEALQQATQEAGDKKQ